MKAARLSHFIIEFVEMKSAPPQTPDYIDLYSDSRQQRMHAQSNSFPFLLKAILPVLNAKMEQIGFSFVHITAYSTCDEHLNSMYIYLLRFLYIYFFLNSCAPLNYKTRLNHARQNDFVKSSFFFAEIGLSQKFFRMHIGNSLWV